MTKKKTNKGQFAPKSKHPVVAELEKSFHLIGAVIGITAWFVTIWLAAVGIGFLVHWTQVHWTWVPGWMLTAGHVIEYLIFAADCISLVWSVGMHLIHHIRGDKHDEETHQKEAHSKDESK